MQPGSFLITTPAIDLDKFLVAGHQMTGQTLSAKADKSARTLTDVERFLSCLETLGTGQPSDAFSPRLLDHVSFSVLVWGDERDLLDYLQITNMPFVVADTVVRGIQVAIVSGTLGKWRDAIISGLKSHVPPNVREIFRTTMWGFESAGLSAIWDGYRKVEVKGGYLLEYHK
jgi:hypothetical protein